MEKVILFYYDNQGKRIEYSCAKRDLKYAIVTLLEQCALDNLGALYYNVDGEDQKIDYYNLTERLYHERYFRDTGSVKQEREV